SGIDRGEADQASADLVGCRDRLGAVGGVVADRTREQRRYINLGLRPPRTGLLGSVPARLVRPRDGSPRVVPGRQADNDPPLGAGRGDLSNRTSPSPTLCRPDLAPTPVCLLGGLAPQRTYGAAPGCPRWDLGPHPPGQRGDPRLDPGCRHRGVRRVPGPECRPADQCGALRAHDAARILVLLPKPLGHLPKADRLILVDPNAP